MGRERAAERPQLSICASAAQGPDVEPSVFCGYFFGAFAKKVTRRKGERSPNSHHKKRISPQSRKPSTPPPTQPQNPLP